jgi:hypothetical protein
LALLVVDAAAILLTARFAAASFYTAYCLRRRLRRARGYWQCACYVAYIVQRYEAAMWAAGCFLLFLFLVKIIWHLLG